MAHRFFFRYLWYRCEWLLVFDIGICEPWSNACPTLHYSDWALAVHLELPTCRIVVMFETIRSQRILALNVWQCSFSVSLSSGELCAPWSGTVFAKLCISWGVLFIMWQGVGWSIFVDFKFVTVWRHIIIQKLFAYRILYVCGSCTPSRFFFATKKYHLLFFVLFSSRSQPFGIFNAFAGSWADGIRTFFEVSWKAWLVVVCG